MEIYADAYVKIGKESTILEMSVAWHVFLTGSNALDGLRGMSRVLLSSMGEG